jgi:hypothetical protein
MVLIPLPPSVAGAQLSWRRSGWGTDFPTIRFSQVSGLFPFSPGGTREGLVGAWRPRRAGSEGSFVARRPGGLEPGGVTWIASEAILKTI